MGADRVSDGQRSRRGRRAAVGRSGSGRAALRRLELLDTAPEEAYERLVRLAATIPDARIALVALVDEDRVWFKAKRGLDDPEVDQDEAFCTRTVELASDQPYVITDTAADPTFAGMDLVRGVAGIRFYAGQVAEWNSAAERLMGLSTAQRAARRPSTRAGGLLRLSVVPLSDDDQSAVVVFSDITAERHAEQLLDAMFAAAPVGLAVLDPHRRVVRANDAYASQRQLAPGMTAGVERRDLVHPEDRRILEGTYASAASAEGPVLAPDMWLRPSGEDRGVSTTVRRLDDGADERPIS